ncbi:hypothetical protein CONCODRAFT_7700 [Conidiobolus coronatus NRRL 28638]|uniref:Uncharacterized protein n=1 Tax=Conidiobolus coronatus (strain ATCC 28846 / CBS 209.66 / NRRL 28638) TaxID=796925 RepID=A0A137P456_CONC2|nr:hypothetical protein CONCODRAFT_7700 [Conidiobolus coronatus NRRL 28638]|eukprot:KXN69810.1 hypothetical protein CONCODRAFT_7700 [Conidiobolus coronatus NRRL 28638]
MKFTALLAAAASTLNILAAPQDGYYYRASGVDALVAINASLKAELEAGGCNRGTYDGYDAYNCNKSIEAFVGLAINIGIGIHLDQ